MSGNELEQLYMLCDCAHCVPWGLGGSFVESLQYWRSVWQADVGVSGEI